MRVPTEQYFPVVLFITLYMQGGSRILVFDENYWAVLSLIVYSVILNKVVLTF